VTALVGRGPTFLADFSAGNNPTLDLQSRLRRVGPETRNLVVAASAGVAIQFWTMWFELSFPGAGVLWEPCNIVTYKLYVGFTITL
jgi:hypothetical protein